MRKIDNKTKHLLSDPRKRREWVKFQLGVEGISLADVAKEAGVSRQCLYQAFRVPYPHMERLIADAVDLTPQTLFPERYDNDGLPNRPGSILRKKGITKVIKDSTGVASRKCRQAQAA